MQSPSAPTLLHLQENSLQTLLTTWTRTLRYHLNDEELSLLLQFSSLITDQTKPQLQNTMDQYMERFEELTNEREQANSKRRYMLEGILIALILRTWLLHLASTPFEPPSHVNLLQYKLQQVLQQHPEISTSILPQTLQDDRDHLHRLFIFILACQVNEEENLLYAQRNKTSLMIAFGLLEERSGHYYQCGGRAASRTLRRERIFQLITGVERARRDRRTTAPPAQQTENETDYFIGFA